METHDMGSAEPGGATETRAPVNSDALTTCSELEPTEAAGGDWRELALCLQFNGDLWFPEKGESPAAAKLLCGRCEVRAECLELALDTNEDYGIWGGLSTAERKALRRRRRLRRTLDRAGVALPFELDEPGCGLSRGRRGGSLMTAVHEVIAVSGECLYRGRDVELACEVYEASPAGTRLVCRHDPAPAGQRPDPDAMSVADEPIPYRLSAIDESVPYALSKAGYAAADMFVVDTTNVAELRRRCPALFTRADTASSADRRRPARGVS